MKRKVISLAIGIALVCSGVVEAASGSPGLEEEAVAEDPSKRCALILAEDMVSTRLLFPVKMQGGFGQEVQQGVRANKLVGEPGSGNKE